MKPTNLILTVAVGILSATPSFAQEAVSKALHQVENYLDSVAYHSVDARYIEVPKQRWRVMGMGNLNEVSLKMKSTSESSGLIFSWEPDVTTGVDGSAGVRVGYRSLIAAYMVKVGHQSGSRFQLGTNGNRFGFNVQYRKFKVADPEVRQTYGITDDFVFTDETPEQQENLKRGMVDYYNYHMDSPIEMKSLLIDGYYVFNHRHYSNASTRGLGYIQRRSAGSFIVGASWLEAEADYANNQNWAVINVMNNIGRIKMRQINLSAGYGYNWVPFKGLVVNLTAMPMVSLDNFLKIWTYDVKGMERIMEDDFSIDDIAIAERGSETNHSRMKFTLMGRAAVVYNYKRWFAAATGQWQQYRYSHKDTTGRLTDWTATASIGYRF
ncbi:MAG: DUF4421 family protein [Bacteroidaceae bacterium]|nr:DUF4421 family protein [Bacteroidaceae bacterium]